MTFTRDWDESAPIDHTKFKQQPGFVRNKAVDVAERLQDLIYGFIAGETEQGMVKKMQFRVQGTAPTTITDGIVLYAQDLDSKAVLKVADEEGNIIELFRKGKIYLNHGILSNNQNLLSYDSTAGTGAAGSGTVSLIKAGSDNLVQLPDGARLATTGAPTTGYQISNKQYVDDKFAAVADETTQVAVGTITITSTGNKTISGLDFQPKLILVWYGFSGRQQGGPEGSGFLHEDGAGSAYSHSESANQAGGSSSDIRAYNNVGSINFQMTLVSMEADGFVVNVGTALSGGVCHYVAIG